MRYYTFIVLMLTGCTSVFPLLPSLRDAGAHPVSISPITGVTQHPSTLTDHEHFFWCADCPTPTLKIADTSPPSTTHSKQGIFRHSASHYPFVIYFDNNSAALSKRAILLLTNHIRHFPSGSIVHIDGFTNSYGSQSSRVYNQMLSERRTEAARRFLVSHTKHHLKYKIHAHGKCCYAHKPESSPENRRVEIYITGGKQ